MDRRIRRPGVLARAPQVEGVAHPPVPTSIEVAGQIVPFCDVAPRGDLLLDVTFDNRRTTGTLAQASDGAHRPEMVGGSYGGKKITSENTRMLYRVESDKLIKASKYFRLLLSSDDFAEGRALAKGHAEMRRRGVDPKSAIAAELPKISIKDDSEPSFMAGRESVFGDLMRILQEPPLRVEFALPYLAVLAVMADRFDCAEWVGAFTRGKMRKPAVLRTFGNLTRKTEESLRQEILVSWLLKDPNRLDMTSKILIVKGSSRWAGGQEQNRAKGIWWDLPGGLEAELQLRRNLILSTIASVQNHFLRLYTSRERQCRLGYDSSGSCDSFQLGEMIRFFTQKGLLNLMSPLSAFDEFPDIYKDDIHGLISTLRECPGYQIDKNHAHCGLRTRMLPVLEYIDSMVTNGKFGIDRQAWESDTRGESWEGVGGDKFTFTRALSAEPRRKIEGYMVSGRDAMRLFTAQEWDWTPEV